MNYVYNEYNVQFFLTLGQHLEAKKIKVIFQKTVFVIVY